MCGIYGVNGKFSEEQLHFALSRLKHRGPDADGIFINSLKTAALVHTRLSIQDLSSSANQPMISESKQFAITYNGEIYNSSELKNKYLPNFKFKTSGDTELLLELFAKYKESILQEINGIFSFGILDLSTNEILIARDRFGVKPLYYRVDSLSFVFASEIKALLTPEHNLSLDKGSIARSLSLLWTPHPNTCFKEIKKLHPGTFMKIRDSKVISSESFYNLDHYQKNDFFFEEKQIHSKKLA